MASIGHIAIGVLAAELAQSLRRHDHGRAFYVRDAFRYSLLALLPDADVVAFGFGIPYAHDFGHRGASHSVAFALLIGVLAYGVLRGRHIERAGAHALLACAVVATHGPLDMLTDGGLGIAIVWPFDSTRHFFPWTPIPVSPIGAGLISARGLRVILTELLYFVPPVFAVLWIRRTRARLFE